MLDYDVEKEKKMIKMLNEITLAGIGNIELDPFKNKLDNVLACLFYGFCLNIGGNIGKTPTANKFVLKHPDPSAKNIQTKVSGTFVQSNKGSFSNLILYGNVTFSNNKINCSLISRLPLTIVKKFIDFTA